MSKQLITLIIALILMAWCLVDSKRTVWEKLGLIIFILAIYVCVRLMQGWSFDQILAPLLR